MYVCVCARARVCLCGYVCACAHARVCVSLFYSPSRILVLSCSLSIGWPPNLSMNSTANTTNATMTRHMAGNKSIEEAISWLAEHEEDPDIDTVPLV